MTSHDATTTKPSLLNRILHPHKSHQETHPGETAQERDAATSDAAVTTQQAEAAISGGGVHAPVSGSTEAPVVGPGVNVGTHGAL